MPEKLPRVFVLGGSTTIQFGPYLEKYLEGRFSYDRKRDSGTERAEDNLDVAQGANAGDSGMVLRYLRNRRNSGGIAADIVLLNCGLHDMKTDPSTGAKQVPISDFASNLRAAVREIREMNLQLIWLRIPPVADEIHNTRCKQFHRFAADVDAYNAVADRVMSQCSVPSIDFHGFCLNFIPDGFVDHIHYGQDVRQLQAAFVAGLLDGWWSRQQTA